jgi:hypothetical protein
VHQACGVDGFDARCSSLGMHGNHGRENDLILCLNLTFHAECSSGWATLCVHES